MGLSPSPGSFRLPVSDATPGSHEIPSAMAKSVKRIQNPPLKERREDPAEKARRLAATAWVVVASAMVGLCIVLPQCIEPGVVPAASISVGFLWLVSPLVAAAAANAIATLTGERIGVVIFKALAVALLLDCLMIGVFLNGSF